MNITPRCLFYVDMDGLCSDPSTHRFLTNCISDVRWQWNA